VKLLQKVLEGYFFDSHCNVPAACIIRPFILWQISKGMHNTWSSSLLFAYLRLRNTLTYLLTYL